MRSSLKKLVALGLATLMLLPLTACATGDEGPAVHETTAAEKSESESVDINYLCELPDSLDYKGEEINILYIKKSGRDDELISEELGHGIISDSVYERNLAVETDLGVAMVFTSMSDDVAAQTFINTTVRGGDDTLDIFSIGTYCAVAPAISGCYLNLSNLEYIDLSKHYWSQDYNTMMTFTSENKQFLATSPAALSLFRLTYLTIFNRDLFNERKIPDLYETVANGDWTLEYQLSLVEDSWVDTDSFNGASEDDFYGFITGTCISADPYCVASGIHLVIRDEDGYLAYNGAKSEALIDMAEKVNALYNNPGTYAFKGQASDDIGLHYIMEKFSEQQGLMATTQFLSIETYIGPLSEFSYGIVPMPKLTKAQADYHTYVQDQVSSFGISSAIVDESRQSMLSAVMEDIAYRSNEIVRPAYYESALSLRFMQDPQSRDILNTMFETIAFDYCYVTGVGSIRDSLRSMLPSKKLSISSRIKSWEKSVNNILKKDNEALDKLP